MCSFVAFKIVVIEKQEELLSEVKEVKKFLRQLVVQNQDPPPAFDHKYPLLPLQNEEEFKLAEKIIVEEDQFKHLVHQSINLMFAKLIFLMLTIFSVFL